MHAYRGILFPLAMFLVELPYLAGQSLMFALPFYFLIGLRRDAGSFFLYTLLLFLISCVLSGMGAFWAFLIDSQALSKIPQCFMFDFMFLFSGLLIPYAGIPEAWRFMYHMGVIPKALNAAGVDQFRCVDDCPAFPVQRGDGVIQQTAKEYASEYLSSSVSDIWPEVGWLFLSVLVVQMMVCLTVQAKITWTMRKSRSDCALLRVLYCTVRVRTTRPNRVPPLAAGMTRLPSKPVLQLLLDP